MVCLFGVLMHFLPDLFAPCNIWSLVANCCVLSIPFIQIHHVVRRVNAGKFHEIFFVLTFKQSALYIGMGVNSEAKNKLLFLAICCFWQLLFLAIVVFGNLLFLAI